MLKTCNWHLKLLERFSRQVSTTAARPASTPGAHSPSPPPPRPRPRCLARPLAHYVCCAVLAWPMAILLLYTCIYTQWWIRDSLLAHILLHSINEGRQMRAGPEDLGLKRNNGQRSFFFLLTHEIINRGYFFYITEWAMSNTIKPWNKIRKFLVPISSQRFALGWLGLPQGI
jgi:hypothetical protein